MTRISLLLMILLLSARVQAQDPAEWQETEFTSMEDYKTLEPTVLECARFVLRVPAEAADPGRRSALNLVSRWMAGTPHYKFVIGESLAQIMKKNEAVLSIYMAAMTKFVLEHPDQARDEAAIKLHAFEMLLDYCQDSNNKVEITKDLKKAIKAKENGKLKEYLKIK